MCGAADPWLVKTVAEQLEESRQGGVNATALAWDTQTCMVCGLTLLYNPVVAAGKGESE